MLINKLREYYGFPDTEQMTFINSRTADMPEALQDEIASKIIQTRQKRFGFPDISILAKFLNDAPKNLKVYYWAVCDDCKAEYDYLFERCPRCYLAGKRSSGYKVRTSKTPPTQQVIRWNIPSLSKNPAYQTCVNCAAKHDSYCRWFGDPNHTCSQVDYECCNCKKRCAIRKRSNAAMLNRGL